MEKGWEKLEKAGEKKQLKKVRNKNEWRVNKFED